MWLQSLYYWTWLLPSTLWITTPGWFLYYLQNYTSTPPVYLCTAKREETLTLKMRNIRKVLYFSTWQDSTQVIFTEAFLLLVQNSLVCSFAHVPEHWSQLLQTIISYSLNREVIFPSLITASNYTKISLQSVNTATSEPHTSWYRS